MADRDDPSQPSPRHEPVGTVAEETARLVEALGGWAQGLGAEQPRPAAAPPHTGKGGSGEPHDGASREAHNGGSGEPRDRASRDPRGGASRDPRDGGSGEPVAGTRTAEQCEHCGSPARAGEALACELCPLCQGIALLRALRPETMERIADVAAALSGALRDIAAERVRGSAPEPPPRGQRVQDIDVDDEDGPRSGAEATGAHPTDTHPSSQESAAP